jgi:hypothetical protein
MTIQEFKKHWKDVTAFAVIVASLAVICGVLLVDTKSSDTQIALANGQAATPSASPAKAVTKESTTPAATPTKKPAHYVEYIAKGEGADVTYGLNKVSKNGRAPLDIVEPLTCDTDVCFYSVIAMLDNNVGNVKVVIKIDGKVIGRSVANESHPTAAIAVNKEYGSGKWVGVPS